MRETINFGKITSSPGWKISLLEILHHVARSLRSPVLRHVMAAVQMAVDGAPRRRVARQARAVRGPGDSQVFDGKLDQSDDALEIRCRMEP